MGQVSVDVKLSQAFRALEGSCSGVCAKTQVWAIILHLDDITQNPQAQQGFGETKTVKHPDWLYNVTYFPPCAKELLYINAFTLIPLRCCDVKLWSHFRGLQRHF